MQKCFWLMLLGLSPASFAAIQGVHVAHEDWEMACDNTGTCRAIGYQTEQQPSVALLLQREAGAHAAVTALVQVLAHEAPASAQLRLDGDDIATLKFEANKAKLDAKSTAYLLEHMQSSSNIELIAEAMQWTISMQGMKIILQSMDDFQAREGTKSAWVNTGRKSTRQLLQPEAMPHYVIRDYRRGTAVHYALNSVPAKNLQHKFRALVTAQDCPMLWHAPSHAQGRVSIYPLNRQHFLVQSPCWRSAYNEGYGMWVVSNDLRSVRQTVTTSATSFSEGHIFSHQKGRGVGDCGLAQEWIWLGQRFVRSYVAQNSQCKGFIGGAWPLPTFISQVSSQ